MKSRILVWFVFLLVCSNTIIAQKSLQLAPSPDLKISGTSSLHDWDMTSKTATGKAVVVIQGQEVSAIQSLFVEMQAESLKSGKSGMDKNAYKALKTATHKTIKFDLKSAQKHGNQWTLTGTFQVAGATKQITLKAIESFNGSEFQLQGSYDFKLTDFGITPPTALMGTVKTGDAVSVSFKTIFK